MSYNSFHPVVQGVLYRLEAQKRHILLHCNSLGVCLNQFVIPEKIFYGEYLPLLHKNLFNNVDRENQKNLIKFHNLLFSKYSLFNNNQFCASRLEDDNILIVAAYQQSSLLKILQLLQPKYEEVCKITNLDLFCNQKIPYIGECYHIWLCRHEVPIDNSD